MSAHYPEGTTLIGSTRSLMMRPKFSATKSAPHTDRAAAIYHADHSLACGAYHGPVKATSAPRRGPTATLPLEGCQGGAYRPARSLGRARPLRDHVRSDSGAAWCPTADFAPEPGLTAAVIAAIRANYGGKVSFVDDWCRRIFDAYAAGLVDDLLVIITSDHGEMAGDHGRVYKRTFHESALRVPLIVRWPGRIPPGTRDALVENIDILPTVLAAIGVPPPPMSLGRSLLPVISNPQAQHRTDLLSEIYYGGSRNTMLKTARHKYVIDQDGRGYMLYDLAEDPDEQHNLIGAPAARTLEQRMRGALLVRLAASAYVMDSVNL